MVGMSAMLGFVSRLLSWLLSVLDGCFGGVEAAGDGMNFLGLTELVASFFVFRTCRNGEIGFQAFLLGCACAFV